MLALLDELPEFAAWSGQVGELAFHLGQVGARNVINLCARPFPVVGKPLPAPSRENPRSRPRRMKLNRSR